MAEHTKLPWRACDDAVFAARDCIALCDTDFKSDVVNRANAAFIVRACNLHDELASAMDKIDSILRRNLTAQNKVGMIDAIMVDIRLTMTEDKTRGK